LTRHTTIVEKGIWPVSQALPKSKTAGLYMGLGLISGSRTS